MAWGRRCDIGCESWPDDLAYKICPLCEEATERFSNLRPLTPSEARELAFEAFYEKWCAKRGVGVDGPLPEESESCSAA